MVRLQQMAKLTIVMLLSLNGARFRRELSSRNFIGLDSTLTDPAIAFSWLVLY